MTTKIPGTLVQVGGNAFLDTMGYLPMGGLLRRVDYEAARNIENRWKASGFYPRPASEVRGRNATRLLRSYRRLFKRTANLGAGVGIGTIARRS